MRIMVESRRCRAIMISAIFSVLLSSLGGPTPSEAASSRDTACPKPGVDKGIKEVKCKYLILGGGAAGLTAAYNLKHHGKVSISAFVVVCLRNFAQIFSTSAAMHACMPDPELDPLWSP